MTDEEKKQLTDEPDSKMNEARELYQNAGILFEDYLENKIDKKTIEEATRKMGKLTREINKMINTLKKS